MTYKVGDKVKVINNELIFNYYRDWAQANRLLKFKAGVSAGNNCEGTVIAVAPHHCSTQWGDNIIGIEVGDHHFIYAENALEKIAPEANGVDSNNNPIFFDASNLKEGMKVKTFGSGNGVVVRRDGELFIAYFRIGFDQVYFKGINPSWSGTADIVEVYTEGSKTLYTQDDFSHSTLVWRSSVLAELLEANKLVAEAEEALAKAIKNREAIVGVK